MAPEGDRRVAGPDGDRRVGTRYDKLATSFLAFVNLAIIRRALIAEGWKQARPDEPWHYSYFIAI